MRNPTSGTQGYLYTQRHRALWKPLCQSQDSSPQNADEEGRRQGWAALPLTQHLAEQGNNILQGMGKKINK